MRLHDIHEIRLTYEGDLPARIRNCLLEDVL